MIPESSTAITTSGRPVSSRHAVSTLMPLTPKSSFGLFSTVGSVVHTLVLANFHISPLQPLISLGSGMQPGGLPEESQRFASAWNGNSARAESATKSVRLTATASGG